MKKKCENFPLHLITSSLKNIKQKNLRLKTYGHIKKTIFFSLNKNSKFQIISKNNFVCQSHIGHDLKNLNPKVNINFIGLRDGNCVFNYEKSLESLQIASFICKDLARMGLPILFVNVISEYNEIIKMAASASYQPILLGDFIGGSFTNNLINKTPAIIFVPSSKEHSFFLKEAYRLNLPTLSINDSDGSTNLSAFPIVVSDDSLELQHSVLGVVSQGLIKGCLFHYADTINHKCLSKSIK
jgi:ribosomal protein S2